MLSVVSLKQRLEPLVVSMCIDCLSLFSQEARRRQGEVLAAFRQRQENFRLGHAAELAEASHLAHAEIPRCVSCRLEDEALLPPQGPFAATAAIAAAAARCTDTYASDSHNPVGLLCHIQVSSLGPAPRATMPPFLVHPPWSVNTTPAGDSSSSSSNNNNNNSNSWLGDITGEKCPVLLSPSSDYQGLVLRSCGHRMHLHCYMRYCRAQSQATLHVELSLPCPYCCQPTNLLLVDSQPMCLAALQLRQLAAGNATATKAIESRTGAWGLRGTPSLLQPKHPSAVAADGKERFSWVYVQQQLRTRLQLQQQRRDDINRRVGLPLRRQYTCYPLSPSPATTEILYLCRSATRLSPLNLPAPMLLMKDAAANVAAAAAGTAGTATERVSDGRRTNVGTGRGGRRGSSSRSNSSQSLHTVPLAYLLEGPLRPRDRGDRPFGLFPYPPLQHHPQLQQRHQQQQEERQGQQHEYTPLDMLQHQQQMMLQQRRIAYGLQHSNERRQRRGLQRVAAAAAVAGAALPVELRKALRPKGPRTLSRRWLLVHPLAVISKVMSDAVDTAEVRLRLQMLLVDLLFLLYSIHSYMLLSLHLLLQLLLLVQMLCCFPS